MVVLLGQNAVVYAGELAVDAEDTGRLDACICWRLWVENPAVGVGDQLVALEESCWGRCRCVRWKKEKDVVGGDREVANNMTIFILVAACYVTMEAWKCQ